MGIISNARNAWKLLEVLEPMAYASTEAEFRAHLPQARAVGKAIWGDGRKLVRQGSAKDAVLGAAAVHLGVSQLLDQGRF